MKFITAILLFVNLAHAETVDLNRMDKALRTVDADTVVAFDLDNTVLQAAQTLGTDQFFGFLVKKAAELGLEGDAAIEWALREATPIQPVTKVQAVEQRTPALIADLQERGITVFALTARPAIWTKGTLRQVRSLGVNFKVTAPEFAYDTASGYVEDGVIFLARGANKGRALVSLLKEHPKRIIFIDDKLSNVQSVESALSTTSIEHLSVRYGGADARVRAFNEDVAMCEWAEFKATGRFLRDEDCI